VRLVTWNCNGALRRKGHLLDELEADVLVVQECEDPAEYGADYREWAGDFQWIGDLRFKGLGIFARRGHSLERLRWTGDEFRLFLPVRIGRTVDLVGVWTQATKPASSGYIGQFWRYLQANRKAVTEQTVFCGDFNSNQIWDKERQIGNHSQCVDELETEGLVSLYHHALDEAHGSETAPTFYLYRKPERPFHLDYIFAHRALAQNAECAVRLGVSDEWLTASDHVPLIVDLPFEQL
jgi:exodeoxyribonuclease-3